MWLFIAWCTAAYADSRAVIASSGLRIREAPDNTSEILGKAPYGAQVEVVALGEPVEVGGEWGRWAQVEWKGEQGFLFDRWLSSYPLLQDCADLATWVDAAFGAPIRVEVDVAESCECPDRRVSTVRLYPGEVQLSQEEGWQIRSELLSFSPSSAVRVEELWLVARACLQQGGDLPARYPTRGGWVETATHLRVRLTSGAQGASIEASLMQPAPR